MSTPEIVTFGCRLNAYESEVMRDHAEKAGLADAIVFNTCAVTAEAARQARQAIRKARREHPQSRIVVTGCAAQTDPVSFAAMPEVDLILGNDEKMKPESWQQTGSGNRVAVGDIMAVRGTPRQMIDGLKEKTRAFVQVQNGCDHRCTFCIVPYVRGPEKNRDASEVIAEVEGLAARGVSEVTLLGQTVNSYRSGDVTFPVLLRRVARVPGIRRVRFTSPHPNDVIPELVEVMAEESAVCEHLHLPAQSGSDRTLKRMLRRYSVEELLKKVELVRAAVPGVALSTDIIVAFPGETDAEFRETLDLMRAVRFDEAYTYKYSLRDGTPAARLPAEDFVGGEEAQARLEELIEVARGITAQINAAEVGRLEEVLIEKAGRRAGQVLGRTRRNKVVAFDGDMGRVGEYAHVELLHTTGATFGGAEVTAATSAANA